MAGRRLFCFAMQSRSRRRKKVAARPLREGDRGVARTLRSDQVIEGRNELAWSRSDKKPRRPAHTTGAALIQSGRIGVIAIEPVADEKDFDGE
jgi:hypothetical protein